MLGTGGGGPAGAAARPLTTAYQGWPRETAIFVGPTIRHFLPPLLLQIGYASCSIGRYATRPRSATSVVHVDLAAPRRSLGAPAAAAVVAAPAAAAELPQHLPWCT